MGVVALVRAGMVRWPLGPGAQLLGRLGPRNLLKGCRLVIQGGSAIADRFVSEGARAFLVAPGMHSDLQPEVGGSGAYALIMHLGERVGMPVAEGGSGAVSAALAEAIRHAGGVITTGRRVDRIVVEGGRAVGVEAGVDAFGARRGGHRRAGPAAGDPAGRTGCLPVTQPAQLPRYRRGLGTSSSTGRWAAGAVAGRGVPAWSMSAIRSRR